MKALCTQLAKDFKYKGISAKEREDSKVCLKIKRGTLTDFQTRGRNSALWNKQGMGNYNP